MRLQYKKDVLSAVSNLLESLNSIEELSLDNLTDKELIESSEK